MQEAQYLSAPKHGVFILIQSQYFVYSNIGDSGNRVANGPDYELYSFGKHTLSREHISFGL